MTVCDSCQSLHASPAEIGAPHHPLTARPRALHFRRRRVPDRSFNSHRTRRGVNATFSDVPLSSSARAPTAASQAVTAKMGYVVGEDGLSVQDADGLDPTSLTPLTPEVISRQATINIGA